MAIRNGALRREHGYRLIARLSLREGTTEEIFKRACTAIYSWVQLNTIFCLPNKIQSFNERDGSTGASLGVFYDREATHFAMRLLTPDEQVPARFWTTEAEVHPYDGILYLGVRVQACSPASCTAPLPHSRPSFVDAIARRVGLRDVHRLRDSAWTLRDYEEVDKLAELIYAPKRQLPIVLLTECMSAGQGFYRGYMLDAAKLAAELYCTAHVVKLPNTLTWTLTNAVGKANTAYDGTVRVYFPGGYTAPGLRPYATKREIEWRHYNQTKGETPYHELLLDKLRWYNAENQIDWEAWGFEFYLAAEQRALEQERSAGGHSTALLEQQIQSLQAERDDYLALSDTYAGDAAYLKTENYELRKQTKSLRALAEGYRHTIEELTHSPMESVPLGVTYEDMAAWVEEYYPDRLYLHARAVQALKSACFEDVALVYRCLILLATDYRELRQGFITRAEFEDRCRSIAPGLEEGGAISDTGAGLHGSDYFITYNGRPRKLDRHLAKGDSREARYCLRVYFFWDEEEQIVVVGSLPQHLDNGLT